MHINLQKIVAELEAFLKAHNIPFKNGLPILPQNAILREMPVEILPHSNRLKAKNPSKTVICHFSKDELLYISLKKLNSRIKIWKNYMGVCGFDFSVRAGDDPIYQNFYLYLNKLIDVYIALHGIKILPNFRIGGERETLDILKNYPPQTSFAVGTLGTNTGNVLESEFLLREKLIFSRPKHLCIYGKLRENYKNILEEFNVKYTVYKDYQQRSRQGEI